MKKIFKIGTVIIGIAPVISVVSCGIQQQEEVKWRRGVFLEARVQENKDRGHIVFPEIKREEIKKYNPDISASFGVPLVSGGFGDMRYFYSMKNNLSIHAGDDAFTKAGSDVFAPFDGEVLGVWGKSKVGEIGGGFGTQVIMKVKVSDMFLNPEISKKFEGNDYAYLTFGHLSLSTPTLFKNTKTKQFHIDLSKYKRGIWNWSYNSSINIKHPYKVKGGDLIGKVGKLSENGGWVPHVHVEVYRGDSQHFNAKRIGKYIMDPNQSSEQFKTKGHRVFGNLKGLGVYSIMRSSKEMINALFNGGQYKIKNKTKIIEKNDSFKEKNGLIDPNLIYKLWTPKSKNYTLN
ncbi:hypothetical protein [Mycoplasma marinum]|uniref:Peptidase M23 domain-containing protein n=1 Tax=Mycoplasma marinum TaxID=1937190 RepID=A0A4R0XTN7_9MOLU|nr:hypothetical protein [Mycoplasma marinum]TCG11009.1 hypothetical protein C4B24_03225 [Mycoplasma marinum]